ncbi:hypothetical protein B0A49_07447 [Cryomyces minteri]|uniref:TauD/TfdA-like domain-containing protein n=1 Tax=Cryomyces minteri TaxID=331657 RepID=A0A4U0XAM7_9PEZI|nr:hypothetical protein B0A49_07447 [Cryomyces minteri]
MPLRIGGRSYSTVGHHGGALPTEGDGNKNLGPAYFSLATGNQKETQERLMKSPEAERLSLVNKAAKRIPRQYQRRAAAANEKNHGYAAQSIQEAMKGAPVRTTVRPKVGAEAISRGDPGNRSIPLKQRNIIQITEDGWFNRLDPKLFQTSDIPGDCQASESTENNGTLTVHWTNDVAGYDSNHVSEYSLEAIKKQVLKAPASSDIVHQRIPWDKTTMEEKVMWLDYDEYMNRDETLFDALKQLQIYGLVFLRNVPDSEVEVERVAGRMGNLRDTFYGRTWDVKSVVNAKNIAYTHQYLGLHMDLLYMQHPPHIQLLHCLRSTSTGGASLFSDALHAAEALYRAQPRAFTVLTNYPVPYHYDHAPAHYYANTHPTIELAWPRGSVSTAAPPGRPAPPPIAHLNWSPPFQAPLRLPRHDVARNRFRAFQAATRDFGRLVEHEDAVFEHRLGPGECVLFLNRRVLHARRAFDVGVGERWLKGAYVDSDVFESKLRVLGARFGGGQVVG